MKTHSPQVIGIAVLESGGRFLVGCRGSDGPLAGYDEFPGGKCRADESPAACAVRECGEETGLAVEAVELLLRREFAYAHATVDLHFWRCRPVDTTGDAAPENGFRWVTADELATLHFPEANAPLLELLRSL
ncbi:8-oxo-dGTP diphosphatase [Symmachiella macrocystis]|uniref:8-oxo-dGTP diphosphatase n=1 Tax=Symmachiella macrocystis TaxID=2527985 RepID=A0A5C6BKY2_9PLAN|nr:(deoxy)nucleoside triphosphate pyrophosphohydrolase [Symmachiella macrocystis]TWU12402.1 8-oxo-dGTP diphosphatase [Symmachiella macrocystis]